MKLSNLTIPFLLAVFVALALLAAACGGDDDDDDSETTDSDATAAESPADGESGTVPTTGDTAGTVPTGEGDIEEVTESDIPPEVYAEYDGLVGFVIEDLEFYWGQILPEIFGVEWQPVSIEGAYTNESDGPDCGGEPATPENAFYCPLGDFIAWDEPTLLLPYYTEIGDFGAAFVLAHEYGHAVQARLGIQAEFTIQFELQADCFAGAWALDTNERGILEEGDLEEGVLAIYTVADPEEVLWTDPAAHGTADDRLQAFTIGFEQGAEACLAFTEQDQG